jgi:hypothetical protein
MSGVRISGFDRSVGELMILCANGRRFYQPPSNNGMQQTRTSATLLSFMALARR